MSNYKQAIEGVKIASKILNISIPNIVFCSNTEDKLSCYSAMFLQESYKIVFFESWLKTASYLEIQMVCFHETRHAFQNSVISGLYQEHELISLDTIAKWKNEFSCYNQGTGNLCQDDKYLLQDIEIDAIAFAYNQMSVLFGVQPILPNKIKQQVLEKLNI